MFSSNAGKQAHSIFQSLGKTLFLVFCVLLVAPWAAPAQMLESFEYGVPPPGWVKTNLLGGSGWYQLPVGVMPLPGWGNGTSSVPPTAGAGSYNAYCSWNTGGGSGEGYHNDQWLISPRLTGLTATSTVSYWLRFNFTNFPDQVFVRISTAGPAPANFTYIIYTNNFTRQSGPGQFPPWSNTVVNIGNLGIAPGTPIWIAFQEYVWDNIWNGAAVQLDVISSDLTAPPEPRVSPTSLTFTVYYDGTDPAPQTFSIRSVGSSGMSFSRNTTFGAGPTNWLTMSVPSSGTLAFQDSQIFTAQVSVAGLDLGTYYATNVFTVPGAANSPLRVPITFKVIRRPQTITFPNPGPQFTTNRVGLAGTASSGLQVTFSVFSGPGSIVGATNLSFTGTGTVKVIGWQLGNVYYDMAPCVTNSIAVTKAMANIAFSNLVQQRDGTPRVVTATTTPEGLPVTITYNGSVSAPLSAGSYAITGVVDTALFQGMNTATLTVLGTPQTISFPAIGSQVTTNHLGLAATASSGLPVTFSVGGGPAALSGDTNLSFTGAGIVSIVASQAGDANYAPAATTNSFAVTKAVASVALNNLNQTYNGTPRVVTATTEPVGLAVLITYNGSLDAPVSGGSYAVTGTVSDAIWQGEAVDTLTVGKVNQTLTFDPIVPQKLSASVGLAATASSGLDVSFTTRAPGSISDGTNLTFTGVGDIEVVAVQAGNADYNAAPSVTNVVKVFSVTPDVGLFAGGFAVVVSNGFFGTITNVLVGGLAANIEESDENWVRITMPAAGSYGIKDIVIQTSDYGDTMLADAYTVGARAKDLPLGAVVYDDNWTWDGQILAWRVVHSNYGGVANTVSLQGTNSIAARAFHEGAWNNRWQDATLRTWLNSTNFLGVFSPAFSGIVIRTAVPWALSNPVNEPSSGITTDQVFIASRTELGGTELAGDGFVFDWFDDPGTAASRRADLSPSPMTYWTRTGERAQYSGTWYDLSAYSVNVPAGTISSGSWTGDGLQVIPVVNIPGTVEFALQPDGRYKLFGRMNQTITFPNPGDQITTNVTTLTASAESGQPVSYTVLSGPAILNGASALTFTDAGTVTVVAVQPGNAYWDPSPKVTNTFTVTRATAQVFLLDLSQPYDGTARTVSATTTPVGLTVTFTYNGDGWAPTNAGVYAVTGTVTEAMWQGSAEGVLEVGKADATIAVGGVTVTYDGLAHGATGTVTGATGENLNALLDLGAKYTNVPGGTAIWTFAGNANYNAANGQVDVVIGKADATIAVGGVTVTYDGQAHGATGTAIGAASEDLSGLLDLGATYTEVPGGTADWTFAGNENYSPTNGSVQIAIAQKMLAVTANNQSKIYDGAIFPIENYTVTFSGFVQGEGPAGLGGELSFTGSAIPAVDIGEYEITPQGLTSDNYDIRFVAGTLRILPEELRINCGGSDVGDWVKDFGFSGNTKEYGVSRQIKNAGNAPQKVLRQIRGVLAPNRLNYNFVQVPPGKYMVRLHFADIYKPGQGNSRFDVRIEDIRMLAGFDVYGAAGGFDRGVVKEFRVTVDGDGLQLEFRPRKGGAYINAIEVLPMHETEAGAVEASRDISEKRVAFDGACGSASVIPLDVWTSGNRDGNSGGSNTVDSDLSTAWVGDPDAATWWITLGYRLPTPVSGVNVFLGKDSITNMSFVGSRDGLEWFDVGEALDEGPTEVEYLWIQFLPGEGEADLVPNVLEIEIEKPGSSE